LDKGAALLAAKRIEMQDPTLSYLEKHMSEDLLLQFMHEVAWSMVHP
jgi:hypothetical protein